MLKEVPVYKSESDKLLESWGYDLLGEYFQIIQAADIPKDQYIFETATGSGRAASTLSRLYPYIITADYDLNRIAEAEKRIPEEFKHKVKYLRLNLEHIPFDDNSISNIVCINTVHELDNPWLCLNELIRILSPGGKLLVADFNPEGLDVMDRLHEIRYGGLHPRGRILFPEVKKLFTARFSFVKEIRTKLNTAYLAEKKHVF